MSEERALTVSEVVGRAKRALEGIRVRVVGEVSELTDKPGYKAVYFSIHDEDATLPCLAWRDRYAASGVELEVGALVQLDGHLTVYPPKGRMQFVVRSLALAGEGVLRMRVAALARRLDAEGLMAASRKRRPPDMPDRIGLVTSPRGKAVHDVVRALRRRYPLAVLVLAGVRVEGADAATAVASAIGSMSADGDVDVIIVCRGGGSYEDLMPFNSEEVARAIAGCPVPVVTGIGHEPDTTIADMVADVRCSTPTAAAEAVAPAMQEVDAHLVHVGSRMASALGSAAGEASHRLAGLADRPCLVDPTSLFAAQAQRVDLAAGRLDGAVARILDDRRVDVEATTGRLRDLGRRATERFSAVVESSAARLGSLSPHAVLERGYSISLDEEGRVIRDAAELDVGDTVRLTFARGRASARITDTTVEEA